jgi:hypothetical protein
VDFPVPGRFELAGLSPSYTDLHCSIDGLEQPAVCLCCGAALDADGKGKATAHVKDCGGGSGMFFLLQVQELAQPALTPPPPPHTTPSHLHTQTLSPSPSSRVRKGSPLIVPRDAVPPAKKTRQRLSSGKS